MDLSIEDLLRNKVNARPIIRVSISDEDMQEILDEFCKKYQLVGKLSICVEDKYLSRPTLESRNLLMEDLDRFPPLFDANTDDSMKMDLVVSDVIGEPCTVEGYMNESYSYDLIFDYKL